MATTTRTKTADEMADELIAAHPTWTFVAINKRSRWAEFTDNEDHGRTVIVELTDEMMTR